MDYGDLLSLHQNMVFMIVFMDYVIQMAPSSMCNHICLVMNSMFWVFNLGIWWLLMDLRF